MFSDMAFLGCDVSSTGAGAVLLGPDDEIMGAWCWQAEGTEDERMASLRSWSEELAAEIRKVDAFVSCAIECPIYRGGSSVVLAGASWIIRSAYPAEWTPINIHAVKATAHQLTGVQTSGIAVTSKPGLGKQRMEEAALKQWGRLTLLVAHASKQPDPGKAIGDLVDALWVSKTDQLAVRAATGGS